LGRRRLCVHHHRRRRQLAVLTCNKNGILQLNHELKKFNDFVDNTLRVLLRNVALVGS
jgi:uncharacterized protein YlbG (UPF0298 family)